MSTALEQIAAGERFAFGENWAEFLRGLNPERIAGAEQSLRDFLEVAHLEGSSFADVGCGSGLFSLAARRLGARVHSFDFDPASVGCARELKRRYFPDGPAQGAPRAPAWTIEQGSVLDTGYLASLGQFDTVYAWGVLHHTGAMWTALENVTLLVRPGGKLYISIYNDQGGTSRRWRHVKKMYNRLPRPLRFLLLWPSAVCLWWRVVLGDFVRLRPFATFRNYRKQRGMSAWRDVVDWVGGFPFEVARPERIFDFYRQRGFTLERLRTTLSLGCNQFVFRRTGRPLGPGARL
jgi:2-polyprenyl-6-hydroxyphenyl methylase/3-demethylubiquinone-9 3-methyltransferase